MKKLLIIIVFVVLLIFASNYAYKVGVTTGHSFTLAGYIPLVKQQDECLNKEGPEKEKCLDAVNKLLIAITTGNAEALQKYGVGLSKEFNKTLDNYLSWVNSNHQ